MLLVPEAALLASPPLPSRHHCERTWWSGFGIVSRSSAMAVESVSCRPDANQDAADCPNLGVLAVKWPGLAPLCAYYCGTAAGHQIEHQTLIGFWSQSAVEGLGRGAYPNSMSIQCGDEAVFELIHMCPPFWMKTG
jgi:hypothetical protein